MTPLEVLQSLVQGAMHLDRFRATPRNPGRPGEMVERLSAEKRAILQELRSSDVAEVLNEAYYGYYGAQTRTRGWGAYSDAIVKFEKDVLGIDARTLRKKWGDFE